MDISELRDIIRAGESGGVEFMRNARDLSAVGRTVCALANSTGGAVAIGVAADGSIIGEGGDPEKVQERVKRLVRTGLSAPVSARLGTLVESGRWVHWIKVARRPGFEPVRYADRYWVRRGRSTVEPSPSELEDLFKAFGFVMTEERVISSAEEDDIDLGVFAAYLRAMGLESERGSQPTMTDDLRNRDVVAEFDGTIRPTLYGMLAFGKHPQQYAPIRNFVVRCTAHLGSHQGTEVISTTESRGRLDEQILRSLDWVRALDGGQRDEGIGRTDSPLVPQRALREALVNTVVHRDYSIVGSAVELDVLSDRVLITSPGSLPNHMTVESVRAGGRPRSRNELMANAMVVARLMERRGRGWLLMREEMARQNRPEPEITNERDGRTVQVTLWRGHLEPSASAHRC